MIDPTPFGLLLALGTWSALDGTAVGQILISRPIVSATLAGFILGDPSTGLLVGVLLEGVHLGEVPAGGVRLPEPGPGGVLATLLAVTLPGSGGVALGVGLGTMWSLLGGLTVHWQRRLNGRIAVVPEEGHTTGTLARTHWSCVLTDAVRGLLLTAFGIGVSLSVPVDWAARWPLDLQATTALLAAPGLLAAGALLRSWLSPAGRRVILVLGGAAGLVLGLLF